MVERLPKGAFWSAAGIGRFQFSMNALGIAMSGNIRTGLEDNLYLDAEKKELASNETLVKRITTYALALGRPIATPHQTRQMLGIPSEK
jgi:3-keto-5-aminohexanoate cleavage enzyme